MLLCPVIDLAATTGSRQEFAKGHMIDTATVARDIEHCLGDTAAAADMPSPLRHGAPGRSPPTIIIAAECDPFRDEAARLAADLLAAGVPVWHTCHAGMLHSFYGLGAFLPQAEPALAEAGRQIGELLRL